MAIRNGGLIVDPVVTIGIPGYSVMCHVVKFFKAPIYVGDWSNNMFFTTTIVNKDKFSAYVVSIFNQIMKYI